MNKIKLIFIGILICNFSFAQNVYNYTGIVKDKNSNLPLEDATVIVKPLRSRGAGYYSGVKTDENGKFEVQTSFRLPLNIMVSRKGCTSRNIKVKRLNDTFEIIMECEQETIDLIIEESKKDDDNDGVVNKDDECPDVQGPAENNGCPYPDNDEDGVPNQDDNCPDEKGSPDNKGCPLPDRDGDGVPDATDKCPEIKGTAEFDGCPNQKNKIVELLNENRIILFSVDSSVLSKEGIDFLESMLPYIVQSPNLAIEVSGHASSDGSSSYNQVLSEKRAQSVAEYLRNKGVKESQIQTIGLGETQPIESNSNEMGRAKNRRIEIKISN